VVGLELGGYVSKNRKVNGYVKAAIKLWKLEAQVATIKNDVQRRYDELNGGQIAEASRLLRESVFRSLS
jgi:hypothetical protein